MDKHFIVLNGKRYDAVTGKLLGAHADVSDTPKPVHRAITREHHVSAKNVHAPRTHVSHHARTATTKPLTSAPVQVVVQKTNQQIAQPRPKQIVPHHATHLKTQAPKTLMRRVVHKPAGKDYPVLKTQYPVMKAGSNIQVMAPKRLAHNVDDKRLSRAKQIPISDHVGRFQSAALAPIAPKQLQPQKTAQRPVEIASNIVSKPQPRQAKSSIFEQALAEARSHEQTLPKKNSSRRMLGAVSGVAALFIIGGVVIIANNARLETQLASVQAGFQVATPAHVPAGFTKNDTAVAGKAVAFNYVSGIDKSTYTLTQESSNWNSQTLFDNIYEQYGSSYQAIQHNGQTIYVYGDSEASWVNGGILYKITGNADLTTDDILAIADSI